MAAQVIKLILSELDGSAKLGEEIANDYLSEAFKEFDRAYELFDRLMVKMDFSQSARRTFYKDVEKDNMRIKGYRQTLRNLLKMRNSLRKAILKLPRREELMTSPIRENFQDYLRRMITLNNLFSSVNEAGFRPSSKPIKRSCLAYLRRLLLYFWFKNS
ncbi:MAG: hypothetical protein QW238_06915 [Candidatus Bathyarchaeia archaeon]